MYYSSQQNMNRARTGALNFLDSIVQVFPRRLIVPSFARAI